MILQAALDGLVYSGLYAMLGIAFYLTFGVLRRIDMSFGTVLMASVYLAAMFTAGIELPFAALLVSLVLAVSMGITVSIIAFRVAGGDARYSMASTLGIWMALEEIVIQSPGRGQGQPVPQLFSDLAIPLGPMTFRLDHLLVLAVAIAIALGLSILLRKTNVGLAIRASAYDSQVAALMGASPSRVAFISTALAASVGCVAGYLFAASQQSMDIHFGMWATIKGLVILVASRMGRLRNIVIAALMLGVFERVATELVGPTWRELIGLSLLLLVLALLPRALSASATEPSR